MNKDFRQSVTDVFGAIPANGLWYDQAKQGTALPYGTWKLLGIADIGVLASFVGDTTLQLRFFSGASGPAECETMFADAMAKNFAILQPVGFHPISLIMTHPLSVFKDPKSRHHPSEWQCMVAFDIFIQPKK